MKQAFLLIVFVCFSVASIAAQTVDSDDALSWNDVQATVALNDKFDLYFQGTARFGQNITRLNEHRGVVGFVYKPGKRWTIQPTYLYIEARGSGRTFRHEDRLSLRVGYHFPIKKFDLHHRSSVERRLRAPQNSWRYRPSLTFEKSIKKFIPDASVFITEEVFYDSLVKKFSRNRISAGVTKKLSEKLSLDVYYLRQNDGYTRPGDLHVIGTNWKIKL